MHLWPSVRLRDSFKIAYLKKLEWNLQRMNLEKQSQSPRNQQRLLDNEANGVVDGEVPVAATSKAPSVTAADICRGIFMVLSCCYCCFCCGACIDEEDN
ncbi:hypothetical protein HS088_TW21G01668 [Tripterygium wilfordii]|uniref:Uncharacterized protein n=1 Tax=Tripterygium wilfordii TaxID=458696 RepID=A0A7J7C5V9_TRIWF|nr:hypothetical protein HS088_TW21G01668 [Tripterygium wilfordii]